jgi:cell fate regulator YaaT (PSP1 superfamily)
MPCNGCQSRGVIDSDQSIFSKEGLNKLNSTDWISKYEDRTNNENIVEIQFKNTRKEFYLNSNKIQLKKGDIVSVESQYGHDVGTVTMTSSLVWNQLKRKRIDLDRFELRKIYRKATQNDLLKWKEAMELEQPTMIRTRQIVSELGLDMKVGDVEYQGDKSKAIFYYIAEYRVDFRELIRILAREFGIRVEMKQIGSRQEAGRIGGIGSCGRELCCSSWKSELNSVVLNAAKVQELPANVQKLAGQCGKLKCCLMYELDTYMEAREDIPKLLLELETIDGLAYHHKTDILKRVMYYSFDKSSPENLIPVSVDRVKEVISLNKKGIKVERLVEEQTKQETVIDYVSETTDVNRFDFNNTVGGRRGGSKRQ